MQQLKERDSVEAAFLEMAEQVRIPLSLAKSLLGRALKTADSVGSSNLDKALRQLAKLQITFDRLALWRPDLDAENVRVNRWLVRGRSRGRQRIDIAEPRANQLRSFDRARVAGVSDSGGPGDQADMLLQSGAYVGRAG